MRYEGQTDPDVPYNAGPRYLRDLERLTAAMIATSFVVSHPVSQSPLVVLSKECHQIVADSCGVRWGPVDGGPGWDGGGWATLGYCYKQPAKKAEINKGDAVSHGSLRPFAKVFKDLVDQAEQNIRRLRGEIQNLVQLSRQVSDPRKALAYAAADMNFAARWGKPWRELARSYAPDLLENLDGG